MLTKVVIAGLKGHRVVQSGGQDRIDTNYSGDSSFVKYLESSAPQLLPWNSEHAAHAEHPAHAEQTAQAEHAAHAQHPRSTQQVPAPHGTTVLALIYADGVLIAGDRRATMGNLIAQRDLEKVYPTDEFSAVAFAGTVGVALDLIKLYQVELEHYEKLEGVPLTVEGKVNKLSNLIRSNLGLAQQGLAVVPLFAAYDDAQGIGRLFTSDVAGSMHEDRQYDSVGSGSQLAKSALKKLYRPGLAEPQAARICVEALYDAADDDSATGGPDLVRDIYPILASITAAGYRRYNGTEVGSIAHAVVADRSVATP